MTEAAIASIAVAAVVATVLTAGVAGFAVVGTTAAASATAGTVLATSVAVAVTSTAVSTVAISATSTSMNAEGDFFKQAKSISKDSWDSATSRDAFESYLIAAGTVLLTAGLTAGYDAAVNGLSSSTTAASTATSATATSATVTTGTTATTTATNATITTQAITALKESALSTVSSTAVQSAVNGDSFLEAMKNQGVNILIGAVANVGAKAIGNAAHSPKLDANGNVMRDAAGNVINQVSKIEQYALHGILGCGMAAAGKGDCASGAMSGVVAEMVARPIFDKLNSGNTYENGVIVNDQFTRSRNTAIELSGLIGGYSAIFTGNAVGLSDSEVAQNIFSGQRIGKNAAENNNLALVALAVREAGKLLWTSGTAVSAAYAVKKTQEALNSEGEDSSSDSSNHSSNNSSAAGGAPDPDFDPDDGDDNKKYDTASRVDDQLNDSRMQNLQGKLTTNDLKNLANNPNAQRYFDNNSGHINIIQKVDGVNLRITITNDPNIPKIISVGPIRVNQVANAINNGRFVPLK